jgi:DNA-binding CsgD family transcriptional regulator
MVLERIDDSALIEVLSPSDAVAVERHSATRSGAVRRHPPVIFVLDGHFRAIAYFDRLLSPERLPEFERRASELGEIVRCHLEAQGNEAPTGYSEIVRGGALVRVMRLGGLMQGFVVFVEPLRRRGPSAEAAERYRLSSRESQILDCLLRGMSSAEASLLLRISEATVQSHIRNIGLKMQCSRRAEIVARAMGANHGAVTFPRPRGVDAEGGRGRSDG